MVEFEDDNIVRDHCGNGWELERSSHFLLGKGWCPLLLTADGESLAEGQLAPGVRKQED